MKQKKTAFLILGLLTIDSMSGYEMKKMIATTTDHFWSESNGQLYPTLARLKKDHLITLTQPSHSSTKISHRYAITKKGRVFLEHWLTETAESKLVRRDEELLQLFFGANASPAITVMLLKRRQERARDRLRQYALLEESIGRHARSPHVLYWSLTLKNGICHAQAEDRWCEEAIRTLINGRTPDPS